MPLRLMLRGSIAVVAVLLLAVPSALAAHDAHPAKAYASRNAGSRHKAVGRARGKRRATLHRGAPTGAEVQSAAVLLGDSRVESQRDSLLAGRAEAFRFRAGTSGLAGIVHLYVGTASAAGSVIVGLYSDVRGGPGVLLSTGSAEAPRARTWSPVSIGQIQLVSGEAYWLAVLGRGGTLRYRDRRHGSCSSETSAQASLGALPAAWKTAAQYSDCPVSAYVTVDDPAPPSEPTAPLDLAAPLDLTAPLDASVPREPTRLLSSAPPEETTPSPASTVPVNAVPPTIAGSATRGQTLSAEPGTWTGSPASYAYQWQQCSAAGVSCTNVNGATSAEYILASRDVAHTVRVIVSASNASGSASASSAPTDAVVSPPPPAPVNTTPPVVTGTAVEGDTLSATRGTWSGSPTSYVYQWQDCDLLALGCSNVSGATSSSYALAASDVGRTVRVVVTATNVGGSTAAVSAPSVVVLGALIAPLNVLAPTLSGSAVEGETLSASHGTWSGSPTSYAYQWQQCNSGGSGCGNVDGATASSYTLAAGDVGHSVRVLVTASNGGGSSSASSAPTSAVAPIETQPSPPANTAPPAVSGSAQVGQTLSATHGTWSGSPTSYAYQWQQCDASGASCSNVGGATAAAYEAAEADLGHRLRAVVSASNAGGTVAASSAATSVVVAAPPPAPTNTAPPALSGSATEGATLTASNGSWSGSPTSYAYQWQDCNSSGASCANIGGATANARVLSSSDVGRTIRVVVTAANAGGSTAATSSASAEVTAASSGGGAPEPACTVETESIATAKTDMAINGEVVCLKEGGSPYSSIAISSGPSTSSSTLVSAPGKRVVVKGIDITANHVTVEGLHIEGGINVGTGNSTAYNHDVIAWNDITNSSGDGVGVFARVEGPVSEFINIEHNKIHNTSVTSEGDAVHAQGWANLTVRANDIYEISEEVCKGACHDDIFQTYNAGFKTGHDFVFEKNYVHDNDTEGILLKDGDVTPNATIKDNLMIRDERWGGIAGVWVDDCTHNLVIEKNTLTEGNNIQPLSGSCVEPSATIRQNVFGRIKLGGEAASGTYALTSERNLFGESSAGLYKTSTGDETKSLSGSSTYKCSPGCKAGNDDYRLLSNPKEAGIDWSPTEQSWGPNH